MTEHKTPTLTTELHERYVLEMGFEPTTAKRRMNSAVSPLKVKMMCQEPSVMKHTQGLACPSTDGVILLYRKIIFIYENTTSLTVNDGSTT